MSALTFTCANCALDFDEPFCTACGANLVPRKTSGPESLPEIVPGRAKKEATE